MKAWKDKLQPGKQYAADEAFKLVKEFAKAKFNESVDVAVNLGIDASKSDQQVRGSTVMPNGIGKSVRVAVFTSGKNQDAARAAGADRGRAVVAAVGAGQEAIALAGVALFVADGVADQGAARLGERLQAAGVGDGLGAGAQVAIRQQRTGGEDRDQQQRGDQRLAAGARVRVEEARWMPPREHLGMGARTFVLHWLLVCRC